MIQWETVELGEGSKIMNQDLCVIRNLKTGKNCIIWGPANIYDTEMGDNCSVGASCELGGVTMGDNVRMQAKCFAPPMTKIGNNVFVGPGVFFANDDRPPRSKEHWKGVTVEDGASLGMRSTYRAGIVVGHDSLVGQGSNVVKDVPPNVVVCGNPAKVHAGKTAKLKEDEEFSKWLKPENE